jgi:hypothetical protein
MSQHYTARQLASYGRGPDTELVHMSKKEIKGLQELAMAHGGSLTINPHTGLAEAGFLSNLIPMIAGAALTATGVGAPLAALMVGGGMGIAKGSLKEGLMAGLSAYGGAGLASGLAAAGTSAAVDTAGTAAVDQATTAAATEAAKTTAGQQIGQEATKNAALEGISLPGNYVEMAAQQATPQQIAQSQAQNYLAANQGNLSAETVKGLQSAVPNAQNPLDIVRSAGQANASLAPNVVNPTAGQYVSNVGKGIGSLATNPSQLPGFAGSNVGALTSLALPALEEEQKQPGTPGPDQYEQRLAKYRLAKDYKAYEAPQPNPYYKAQYAQYAEGGITGLAMGGPAPQTNFANPAAADMGTSQYSMATDPYSGNIAQRMAEGGIAKFAGRGGSQVIQDYLDRQKQTDAYLPESVGVPRTGIFRDTDIETYKKPALEASVIRLGKAYGAAGIKPAKLPKTSIKGLGDVSGATPDTTEAAGGGTMRSHLGSYSDGGRMLKGPGDGMSDDIPATISGRQPARLADGEFVVPADVVSHLGNGSTDAGAKKLYSMMAKIRKARTGKKKQAPAVKADRFMPA